MEDFSSSNFFEFHGEKLIALELLKDEERLFTIGEDNWFATGLKKNQMRLRSLDGHKIYYEGPFLAPLGTTFLPEWGVSWQPDGLMVKSFKNPKGPVALVFGMNGNPSDDSSALILTKVDRGFVYSNGIFKFWVDLQAF